MLGTSADVTQLLESAQGGDENAAARLIPLVYQELRRLAAGYMRQERNNHTLQPTALVHEAYLRLVKQTGVKWQSHAHFLGVAAQMMRRILVDHARGHFRVKRGGHQVQVSLEAIGAFPESGTKVLALDEALKRLVLINERQSRIVELRFFGGLTVEETADVLGISPKTVKRDWSLARAWLHREITTRL